MQLSKTLSNATEGVASRKQLFANINAYVERSDAGLACDAIVQPRCESFARHKELTRDSEFACEWPTVARIHLWVFRLGVSPANGIRETRNN
jgi:hypothetical protein